MQPRRKRFGEILVEAKVVSEDALNHALERQRGTGRRLGQVLEDMKVVTEKDIAAALARQFGFKTVANIARATFSTELLALVQAEAALKKLIFPLKTEGSTLYLAMVNPLDMEVIDNLSFKTHLRIIPCVTTPSEIQAAVNQHYYQQDDKADESAKELDTWWTILVVDDQELVRSAIVAALKREGYALIEAEHGADGVKQAVQQKPHLIVTDTVMPRMDGCDMFRALHANQNTRHIPLIALSSRSTAEEEARLLEMGFYDFIAKPINPVRLVARVKRALKMVYGTTPPAR
jgi:CheY-like chemotaxis protein